MPLACDSEEKSHMIVTHEHMTSRKNHVAISPMSNNKCINVLQQRVLSGNAD